MKMKKGTIATPGLSKVFNAPKAGPKGINKGHTIYPHKAKGMEGHPVVTGSTTYYEKNTDLNPV